MASQFDAGKAHGQAQEKVEQKIESAKDSANSAADKTTKAAKSVKESAQGSDSGFIQQAGEKIMNMAQEAVDSVKSTVNK